MAYSLKLECINDNWGMPPEIAIFVPWFNDGKQLPKRQWAAEIVGKCDKYGYERKFLRCKKDYSKSNSNGTRGVYAYYILGDGKLYEVCSPQTWKSDDRYFCTVSGGHLERLTKEDVDEWLKNIST